ncbi:hypothetical protein BCR43DRAFT_127889 [Syncephalastrum racemosum]|uniref:Uncharacterized protein n=1 Tax=Syncephalastrum racemosum TaxID=13706 RepID=A0A1X2HKZ2_SYNRA|nr:hypothetical protein BCR43DRAFT_127889 [Syncephalastrum racemosum]
MLWEAAFLDNPDLRTIRYCSFVYLPYLAQYFTRFENKALPLLGRELHTTGVNLIYRQGASKISCLRRRRKTGPGILKLIKEHCRCDATLRA